MALRCLHIPELGPESGGRRGQPPKPGCRAPPGGAGRDRGWQCLGTASQGHSEGRGVPRLCRDPHSKQWPDGR